MIPSRGIRTSAPMLEWIVSIHSFKKYLVNAYTMPSSMLGARNTTMDKKVIPA